MKKILALVLTAMMLVIGGAAIAEEVTELNWADMEPAAAEMGIETDNFAVYEDIGMMFLVPQVFVQTELTEEDVENGLIDYYMTADETAAIGVYYLDAQGMGLEEFAASLAEEGIEPDLANINGLGAVVYEDAEEDMVGVVFATEAGNMVEFVFAPASDEGFAAVAMTVIGSIQAAE